MNGCKNKTVMLCGVMADKWCLIFKHRQISDKHFVLLSILIVGVPNDFSLHYVEAKLFGKV